MGRSKGALNLEERRGRKGYKEFAAPKSGFKRFSLLSWNTFSVRLPSVHLQVSNLRELSSDLKIGSMSRLKGTTLVAFFFERFNGKEIVTGIMLGADSRLSNKKRFQDNGKKILRIGKNILILMAGNGDGCEKMCAHLTGKLNNPVEVGSLKVEDVLDMVVNYLNANLHVDGDNSNIGSLVAGWDEKEGLQVYRTKLKDQWVHWEGEHNYVSVGNGREHALHFLGKYYERKMSPENAAELALGALYAATNDPFTGGPLQVILVDKEGWHDIHNLDAMDVYSKYFNNMSFETHPQNTLFLVCVEYIFADVLKDYFRYVSHGNIKAASCIAKIGDHHFYRFVCKSADVVSAIYDFVRGSPHKPHSLEENFPHGIYLESGVPVYVQPSSKGLLDHLCNMAKKQHKSCHDDLEVYLKYYENYFSVNGYDQRTMFLVSSEKLLGSELKSIKDKFSPQGNEVIVARWLAKRGNFHFYRVFFRTESEASKAYQVMKAVTDAPPPLQGIPFNIGMFLEPPTKPVYVEMTSKVLLQDICSLPPAPVTKRYKYIV